MHKVSIRGVIGWDVTPRDIRNELEGVKGDLLIEIASPGGFVYSGLDIFNLIRDYDRGKVTTRLMGIAASMASVIALAGDEVEAHDNAVYMIHNAMNIAIGNYRDMQDMADHLKKVSNHLAKIYARKTGKSVDAIQGLLDANNGDGTFLFGEEMVEEGFVDRIIETDDNKKDKDSAFIDARIEIDKCNNIIKELDDSKNDLQKAAACIKPLINFKNNTQNSTPATPGKINKTQTKDGNTMETLQEFLDKNPEAKKSNDSNIAAAVKGAVDKINARIEAAKNYLANDKYPTLSTMALQVVTGETDATALTASVAAIDAMTEKNTSDDAQAEGGEQPETPPQSQGGDTPAEAEASYQAKKKRINGAA